jgi:predicted nucleic acid-binding protein
MAKSIGNMAGLLILSARLSEVDAMRNKETDIGAYIVKVYEDVYERKDILGLKLRIYLDTSVISHLDAPDVPERMEETIRLWNQIKEGKYDVVMSDVVFDELAYCLEPKRSYFVAFIQQIQYERVASNDETVALASKFIDFGILREKSFDDCRHIAAALLNGCDIIVSWNFKHIVNAKTIRGTKVIATMEGYKDVIICSPTMLISGGLDDE